MMDVAESMTDQYIPLFEYRGGMEPAFIDDPGEKFYFNQAFSRTDIG